MAGLRSLVLVAMLLIMVVVLAGCASTAGKEGEGSSSDTLANAGSSGSASSVDGKAGARGRSSGGVSGVVSRPAVKDFVETVALRDIHFDFDRYDIRAEEAQILDANAEWLKSHPEYLLLVEGHADERGTSEYNIALGDRRARASVNYLVAQGVKANRITTISYGEMRPLCRESSESCWAENRRSHFAVQRQRQ
ncbi:MAG TPA: peptidoglycan-associated lipoprotein Pal [Methylomirabilota bacterium]|jgi:peptidoglycan-associated lipoprotein